MTGIRVLVYAMGIGACLLLASPAWPDWTWVQLGGSLNADSGLTAGDISLAAIDNGPMVAWDDSREYYAQMNAWDGYAWQGNTLYNLDGEGGVWCSPVAVAGSGSAIFTVLATTEVHGIRYLTVSSFNGLQPVQTFDTVYYGREPSLAISGGEPYLSYTEFSSYLSMRTSLLVTHWNGTGWEQLGGPLNIDVTEIPANSSLGVASGTPYVAWAEPDCSGVKQIYVKRFVAGAWESLSSLNVNAKNSANNPSLVMDNAAPVVAWNESGDIFVKHWSESTSGWNLLAGSLNRNSGHNASSPHLAVTSGRIYAAWSESNGTAAQVYVSHFDSAGNQWIADGASLNRDATQDASNPQAVCVGDAPYVAFMEAGQIYVKYFTDKTPTPAPSPTVRPTRTPTPTVSVTPTVTITASATPTSTPTPMPPATLAAAITATGTPVSANPLAVDATPDLQGRDIVAYPNPGQGIIHFIWSRTGAEEIKVDIFNFAGERAATLTAFGPAQILGWDAAGMAPGIYFYRAVLTIQGEEIHLGLKKLAIR